MSRKNAPNAASEEEEEEEEEVGDDVEEEVRACVTSAMDANATNANANATNAERIKKGAHARMRWRSRVDVMYV